MQEKSPAYDLSKTTLFAFFPDSRSLAGTSQWMANSGLDWECIPGDSCIRTPSSRETLEKLRQSVSSPEIFVNRKSSDSTNHVYVSISNLGKELFKSSPEKRIALNKRIALFHDKQIIAGDMVFKPTDYAPNKIGIHAAFSDIAHQPLEYRIRNRKPHLVSRTLTPKNAEELSGVFKKIFPDLPTPIVESVVNPGFYRVFIQEAHAQEVLRASQLTDISLSISYSSDCGYIVDDAPASAPATATIPTSSPLTSSPDTSGSWETRESAKRQRAFERGAERYTPFFFY